MLKLKMVDIAPEHATKMPAELSGGMIKAHRTRSCHGTQSRAPFFG